MKAACYVIFGCLALCVCACKKPGCDPAMMGSAGIIGKWNIVVDSTSAGAGSSFAFATYTGKAGDYFDIRSNGYVYSKEGTTLDTSAYHFLSNNSIVINSFVYFSNNTDYPICHIKDVGPNSINIYLPWLFSPGGAFGRSIVLSR
jgi:hypothetical protein